YARARKYRILNTLSVVDTFGDLLVFVLNLELDHLTLGDVVRYNEHGLKLFGFVIFGNGIHLHYTLTDAGRELHFRRYLVVRSIDLFNNLKPLFEHGLVEVGLVDLSVDERLGTTSTVRLDDGVDV